YENLTSAPLGDTIPVAEPRSAITGEPMKIEWGPNWDDNLAGSTEILADDPVLKKVSDEVKSNLEDTFMFYLPRICEHCLNPSCVASCPTGAIYKRSEDGIVLIDQDRCRGWRLCVSGCPYKKVYFNHKTGKAEKCHFCYPRIEAGMPTICAETCVGRLRYIGLILYDVDRVAEAASVEKDTDLYEAQRGVFLDPTDPEVIAGARAEGISDEWIEAAQRSPIYALINTYKVALPLHPEYRTMPMVWYVPPLSPVVDAVSRDGHDGEDLGNLFGALDALRIPMTYLAELFTAGDTTIVEAVLGRLAAMRSYMRDINLGRETQPHIPASVGMTEEQMYAMYRLLAIAKYEERYVIPTAYSENAHELEHMGCSVSSYEDYKSEPFGAADGEPQPVSKESFHVVKKSTRRPRMNLLDWDGNE
ncbi:MAG: nitrate reductase subunit beta, partial [Mycobacterium sp.]